MSDYARKVKRMLTDAGYRRIRQPRGSHEIWAKDDMSGGLVSVPEKLKDRHTANGILKSAGLEKLP